MKIKFLAILLLAFTFSQCKTEPKEAVTTPEISVVADTVAFVLPQAPEGVIHTFKALPYAYNALEPYIDAKTMEIHYTKHHVGYYTKFLDAIKGTELEKTPMTEIFAKISEYPAAVRNTGGGYWNHEFFWSVMVPGGAKQPVGALAEAINKDFGSFDEFKKQFSEAGNKRFGSGWAWLAVDKTGKLFVDSTANQDNPMMNTEEMQGTPLLAVDVWEHAYYLKYQNKRADYLDAFWNVVNWDVVSANYEKALATK